MNRPTLLVASVLFLVGMAPAPTAYSEQDSFDELDALLDANFDAIDDKLEEQFEMIDQAMEAAYQRLSEEIASEWGQDEVKLPTKKTWVGYSADKKTRRTIDFENGMVRIERLIDVDDGTDQVLIDLNKAVLGLQTDTLYDLSKKDLAVQYARELLSSAGIELTPPPPFIETNPLLPDFKSISPSSDELRMLMTKSLASQHGAAISNGPGGQQTTTAVKPLQNKKKKITVSIPLQQGFQLKLANQYHDTIIKEANRQNLPASLVYAVMETESSFNPRARSGVPAYGLMQLVPRSGAMDAYNYVYGEKTLLGPEYLYHPGKNVELGSAYLNILLTRYLRDISNPESRKICAIAAYNTGAGNVARAFIGTNNIRNAAKVINKMSPSEVYDYLRKNLPHDETRRYIEKVTMAEKRYINQGYAGT